MLGMSGTDFLVVRDCKSNEVKIISIEETAYLNNGNKKLRSKLDISAIDLVTSEIKNKKELISLLQNKGLISNNNVDVYITHRTKDINNNHNKSKSKLAFLDIIYEEDLENDNIQMIIYMAKERLLGNTKVMDIHNNRWINNMMADYSGRLISKLMSGQSENEERASYAGALLGRIEKADLGVHNLISSYMYSKRIGNRPEIKKKMIERLCNYRVLRDIVISEKDLDYEVLHKFKRESSLTIEARKKASYPLLIFASNKIDSYSNYDLSKKYTEEEFIAFEKAILENHPFVQTDKDSQIIKQTINEEQIDLNNLSIQQKISGISASDLSNYIDPSDLIEPKKIVVLDDEEVTWSYKKDEEENPYSLNDLEGKSVKKTYVPETSGDSIEEFDEPIKYDFSKLKKYTPPIEEESEEINWISSETKEHFLDKDLDDLTEEEILKIASTQKRL